MVGLPCQLCGLRNKNVSLQNCRSCRRSLGVVYLDLEHQERLARVYLGILGSSAIDQLHLHGTEKAYPGLLTNTTDISFRYWSFIYTQLGLQSTAELTRFSLLRQRIVEHLFIILCSPLLSVRVKLLCDQAEWARCSICRSHRQWCSWCLRR